ncbi:hypothetical protein FFLO_02148 [Filobasidium floriforme]|uniref:Uncharacterized protein n=1 Tax=Filobasidium floriforme TaxID=5210 RepID=A0A8K0NPC2_9TREE|nr:uncharacterized protein HD553DRAFT_306503 [Filobasidium floriforme]KAG7562368.1 hypothetical protein FFLO_02148 [Filobasidium floriforme]KAH8088459.1 hypothetical protein HD553DRAFT_306503 [Filobasidium floriforme]
MTTSTPTSTTTTSKAYSITFPTPFHTSPYRFIVQHTTIGPSTSLLYAGLGTVAGEDDVDHEGDEGSKKDGNGNADAYQAALRNAEGGPDDMTVGIEEPSSSPEYGSNIRVDLRPGSRRLASDWACSFPSRSSTIPNTSTTLLSISNPANNSSSSQSAGPGLGGSDTERGKNIANRLARRTSRQIFLNLNLPHPLPTDLFPASISSSAFPGSSISRTGMGMGPSAGSAGGMGGDPVEAKLVLALEKALVRVLQGDL